ncbi:uncharacterized protein [Primulina eburnea]|uniref:uncharacterized protein n=1 Tax=Primulina eburnea TaxID=1245227 RepID=UPI003C6C5B77
MIHMISGGDNDGDSERARKAHGRRLENFEISRGTDLPQDPLISFGPDDLRGIVAPHNNALVVTATVANYDVARIFIDNRSSVNILFKSTLDQMKVEGFEFKPISTPLYGFAGHAIPPLGQIVLPLSLGNEPRRVTKMTTFIVVDTSSAYNGILGRPALKDFRAVASTYHQKLKFPVGKEVGVLCGDQRVARRCYEVIVKEEGKRARVEVNMIRKGRSGLPVVVREVHEVVDEKPEIVTLGTVIKKEVGELLNAGHIRELVDFTAGHQYLCMLDAYQGYHQIPLTVEDQDKVSFITSEETLCYVVMPFGLKNAGAMYQRLMDRVFSKQVLWLKLNPQKCVFGVKSGKFLGYVVTERGIEANPEKVQAIQDMVSPRGPKYVQHLIGRNAALAREPLWVYLSATEEAVSSVLVKLEGSTQQPVYYVSHALKGAEIRYSGLEKLALALVMTARRLRPYFLSHPIVVLTNSPLGRILTHSDMSGRLVKWTTELGEYDIQYEPKTAIKAQALADFLAETVHQENENPWKVYVDGSSSKDGSGVGVLLISPAGEEVKLAVRLDFRASNHVAEYEAVLAGLRAAINVRATRVLIFSESQLVAQQMKGMYDVKDDKLMEYAREVDRIREKFTEITFEQIPRKENEKADTLAKMAGTMGGWKTRDVLFQVELTPHTS